MIWPTLAISGTRIFEHAMIDGTIVRVYRQGTSARGVIVRRSAVRAMV